MSKKKKKIKYSSKTTRNSLGVMHARKVHQLALIIKFLVFIVFLGKENNSRECYVKQPYNFKNK